MSSKNRQRDLLGRFGHYLNQRREREKLTLRAFAGRARMPYSNIFQMETLRKDPRLTELQKLAKGFRQSLSEFLMPLLERPQPPQLQPETPQTQEQESPQPLPEESPQPPQ
jgi:transcriptional regulator with XRE-family HTH domain